MDTGWVYVWGALVEVEMKPRDEATSIYMFMLQTQPIYVIEPAQLTTKRLIHFQSL